MRKFMTMLAAFLIAAVCYASDDVTVLSGNPAIFQLQEEAELEIDYSNAVVNDKTLDGYLQDRGEDFVRDWPGNAKYAREYFVVRFNKKNKKGMQIVSESSNAKYKIVFQISKLYMGNVSGAILGGFASKAGGVIVSGLLEVVNMETNKSVCCFNIHELQGTSHFSETVRLGLCYFDVASEALKIAKKADTNDGFEESARKTGKSSGNAAAPAKTSAKKTSAQSNASSSKKSNATASNSSKKKTGGAKRSPSGVTHDGSVVTPCLSKAHGQNIPRRRTPILGNFKEICREKKIGAYLDFSEADINGRSEKDFILYMKSGADNDERDSNFPSTWENETKRTFASIITSKANKELKDEDISLRFGSDLSTKYVLKMEVVSVDDDGNNKINYLFINTTTCEVEAQITIESKGGHFGDFMGLIKQGIGSASEDFIKLFLKAID